MKDGIEPKGDEPSRSPECSPDTDDSFSLGEKKKKNDVRSSCFHHKAINYACIDASSELCDNVEKVKK